MAAVAAASWRTRSAAAAADADPGAAPPPPSSAVCVALRCRPLLPDEELDADVRYVLDFPGEGRVRVRGSDTEHLFAYDHAFAPGSTQDQVYAGAVRRMVEQFFRGFNTTVFAYGPTGSGKTYTMGSNGEHRHTEPRHLGVIPRAVTDIFRLARDSGDPCRVTLRFVEIYKEQFRDLLAPGTPSSALEVREGKDGFVSVKGAAEADVRSYQDAMDLVAQACQARVTAATRLNETSSRSHLVCTLTLERRVVQDGVAGRLVSKFNMVDLAGSESPERAGSEGLRLREAVTINKSLLALGHVISALGSPEGRHIPYRSSKLTRMLADALGGNSCTVMICCISPCAMHSRDSLNTLQYAARARAIANRPVLNFIRNKGAGAGTTADDLASVEDDAEAREEARRQRLRAEQAALMERLLRRQAAMLGEMSALQAQVQAMSEPDTALSRFLRGRDGAAAAAVSVSESDPGFAGGGGGGGGMDDDGDSPGHGANGSEDDGSASDKR